MNTIYMNFPHCLMYPHDSIYVVSFPPLLFKRPRTHEVSVFKVLSTCLSYMILRSLCGACGLICTVDALKHPGTVSAVAPCFDRMGI